MRPHPRLEALGRRAVTVPALYLAFALVTALAPALLLAALAHDAARGRLPAAPAARVLVALWCYLLAGAIALPCLAAQWLAAGVGPGRARRLHDSAAATQRAWVSALFRGACALFRLRLVVEGDGAVEPPPVLVFVRHASVIDALLPTVLVSVRHGVALRFVLKRELLADPCFDVVGHRLRNHFVARGGGDTEREVEAVRALAVGLGAREGVAIFPEGTRFSERRRARMLAAASPELRAQVESFTHVLPPRAGGALALLDAAPLPDVLFLAHRGLEGFTTLRDLVDGRVLGATIHVKLWRVPAGEVPRGREARLAWLADQWSRVDAFAAGGSP